LLPAIRRQNLYEQVIEHLQDYIIRNALQPGDRLPTEGELAMRFGVGRQSVREAVKVLESRGIIETRPRKGSRLKKVSTRHLADHLRFMLELDAVTVKEMAAARLAIEKALLPLAIEHADAEDFRRMERAVVRMRELTARGETFADADLEFHQAIAAATRNRVLKGLGGMLHEFFAQLRSHIAPNEKAQRQSIEEHERIYDALRNRDLAAALHLMDEHLSVYDHLDEAWRSAPRVGPPPG
jgi:GntR family transcriptional repressor for pyruvate dehydrogenase complex